MFFFFCVGRSCLFFLSQDPSRVKKILPFEGQLDLTAGAPDAGDDVDDMIQKLDMAMQVHSVYVVARGTYL